MILRCVGDKVPQPERETRGEDGARREMGWGRRK